MTEKIKLIWCPPSERNIQTRLLSLRHWTESKLIGILDCTKTHWRRALSPSFPTPDYGGISTIFCICGENGALPRTVIWDTCHSFLGHQTNKIAKEVVTAYWLFMHENVTLLRWTHKLRGNRWIPYTQITNKPKLCIRVCTFPSKIHPFCTCREKVIWKNRLCFYLGYTILWRRDTTWR